MGITSWMAGKFLVVSLSFGTGDSTLHNDLTFVVIKSSGQEKKLKPSGLVHFCFQLPLLKHYLPNRHVSSTASLTIYCL